MASIFKNAGILACSILLLSASLLCSGSASGQTPVTAADTNRISYPSLNYIFKPGDNGYACYRIPALLSTKGGVLLAFAEARKNGCGDSGDIDMVLRRSTDGGKTWGPMQMVWNDSTNTCGNPVPIQDASNGKIWLVCSWNMGSDHEKQMIAQTSRNTRKAFVLSSSDEGKSWSAARDITNDVKLPGWTWYATGPCHGVQIVNGKYKGRMVVPVNHIESGSDKNYAHTIYSDDHGKSWKLGSNTPQDMMNETTIAEIGNGKLMLNMRNSGKTKRPRKVTISSDGGATWADVHTDSVLVEPICQGSLLNYNVSKKRSVLLFCNPASSTARENLTIRLSKDDGATWLHSKVIYPGPAAYSDIAINQQNEVACLYEAGKVKPYEGIAFITTPLAEMLKP